MLSLTALTTNQRPQQTNSTDCGVFVFAHLFSQAHGLLPIDFTDEHMRNVRRNIAYWLLRFFPPHDGSHSHNDEVTENRNEQSSDYTVQVEDLDYDRRDTFPVFDLPAPIATSCQSPFLLASPISLAPALDDVLPVPFNLVGPLASGVESNLSHSQSEACTVAIGTPPAMILNPPSNAIKLAQANISRGSTTPALAFPISDAALPEPCLVPPIHLHPLADPVLPSTPLLGLPNRSPVRDISNTEYF
jgi:hypothetical protein